jgi:hypothetical protein
MKNSGYIRNQPPEIAKVLVENEQEILQHIITAKTDYFKLVFVSKFVLLLGQQR